VDDPKWVYNWAEWDEDSITTHTLSAILAYADAPFTNTITLTSNLPPRVDAYTATMATAVSPVMTLTNTVGIRQKSKDDEDWIYDPFRESLSLRLFNSKLNATQSYAYDLEEEEHTELRFSLSGYGVSATYTAQRTQGYILGNSGWEAEKDPANPDSTSYLRFQPVSFALSYTLPSTEVHAWKNRMRLNTALSTSFVYDMLRPTTSYFTFTPRLIFDITAFLHVGLSLNSRNNRVFWYFWNLDHHGIDQPPAGVSTNLFTDLGNSFAFWDPKRRTKSGFKLESFTVDVLHELHDWLAIGAMTMTPRKAGEADSLLMEFSISVLWRPMQSIKATIHDTDGTFRLNPGETATT
jgi:hypothetical protein